MGSAARSHPLHIPKCTNPLTVYMAQSLCCTFRQNAKDCLKPVTHRLKVHIGGLQFESQFVNSNRLNRVSTYFSQMRTDFNFKWWQGHQLTVALEGLLFSVANWYVIPLLDLTRKNHVSSNSEAWCSTHLIRVYTETSNNEKSDKRMCKLPVHYESPSESVVKDCDHSCKPFTHYTQFSTVISFIWTLQQWTSVTSLPACNHIQQILRVASHPQANHQVSALKQS